VPQFFLAVPVTRHLVFRSGAGEPVNPGLPPLSEGKFIAVLPSAYWAPIFFKLCADGLNEALSAKLFQLSDVRIASASAASKANDQKTPLPRIAKDPGCHYIIHASCKARRQASHRRQSRKHGRQSPAMEPGIYRREPAISSHLKTRSTENSRKFCKLKRRTAEAPPIQPRTSPRTISIFAAGQRSAVSKIRKRSGGDYSVR